VFGNGVARSSRDPSPWFGTVACFRTGGIWGLSSSSSEYRPFGARPLSTLLEAGEVQIARYVDGLWIRPARRGSGHKSAKEKITYMTGSKLALNTIRRRVSTIRVFYDWCMRVRKRHDQLNPVSRGVRGKERGFVSYAPSAPWIPSESQFADLLLYVFATMSLRNQALILVL